MRMYEVSRMFVDNAGNIITQGFLMAEELYIYALQFSVHVRRY